MIFGFTLYQIAAYFLIYSFLGWGLEVAYAAVTTGKLVNRGFLNGPVCPIYGFGMLTMLFFLTPLLNNNLLLFIGGVIIPSAIELAGGWLLYKIYHTRWWDYTDRPFNLGGYICLEFSLYWGLGAVFMMKLVHPTIAALVGMVPTTAGWIIIALLYILYGVDLVVTTITATGLAEELEALERIADGIHDISDVMTDLIGSTALDADQKLDESRLQIKLAQAELRTAGEKLSAKEIRRTSRAARDKADEAIEAARRAGELARLNAMEAAEAARLAAAGTVERATDRAAELLQLEDLRAELEARSEEMQAQMRAQMQHGSFFGAGRLLHAFPRMRHGRRHLSLDALRERLRRKDDDESQS